MLTPAIEAAILGGLLCLDRTLFQVMLSRPIVTGPLIGLLLGDPMTGLLAGAMVELLWIDRFPMGRYLPPNDTVVAVLVTAGSIVAGKSLGGVSPELIALSVLLFAPAAYIVQAGERMVARSNNRLSRSARASAENGDPRGIVRAHWMGILKTGTLSTVLIFVMLAPGILFLQGIVPLLTDRIMATLHLLFYAIPIVGIAVALSSIKVRGAIPVFSGLFLVVMIGMQFW